jgi:hypothetical protein
LFELQFFFNGRDLLASSEGGRLSLRECGVVDGARVTILDKPNIPAWAGPPKPDGATTRFAPASPARQSVVSTRHRTTGNGLSESRTASPVLERVPPKSRSAQSTFVDEDETEQLLQEGDTDDARMQLAMQMSAQAVSGGEPEPDTDDARMQLAMQMSAQAVSAGEPLARTGEGMQLLDTASQRALLTESLSRSRSFDRDSVKVIDATEQEMEKKVQQFCDVSGETDRAVAWSVLETHGFVVRAALNALFTRQDAGN